MTYIAAIIPSLGRPKIVRRTCEILAAQTRPADTVVVSVTTPLDAPVHDLDNVEVILSKKGSCIQRNMAIDHVKDRADILVFFDDDFIPSPDYIEFVENIFSHRPEISGLTGSVLRDGVKGTGLSFEEASVAIDAAGPLNESPHEEDRPSLYGCNMAFRAEAIGDIRFDERLPLYGWLEDIDFSAQVRRNGPLIRTNALRGVHLGVKGGRTSGLRFGYSQIINPYYLYNKKTMTWHHAADNIARNFVANHLKAIAPEAHIDRRGRVKGNWMAITDIFRGKTNPERILDL